MIKVIDKYSEVLVCISRNQKEVCLMLNLPYHTIRNQKWDSNIKEYRNLQLQKVSDVYGVYNTKYIIK